MAAIQPAIAGDLSGLVVWVEDGDGLTVAVDGAGQLTVRLAAIDAPEICHLKRDPSCKKPSQPFGPESFASLRQLVEGKRVRLRCEDRPDRYGRPVCEVYADSVNVGLEQVTRGLAWYSPYRYKNLELQAAELAARLSRRGLWTQATPVRPADWRRACWGEGVCPR